MCARARVCESVCESVCVAVAVAVFDNNNWKWDSLFWDTSLIISWFTPHISYVCLETVKTSGRSECLVGLACGECDRGVYLKTLFYRSPCTEANNRGEV